MVKVLIFGITGRMGNELLSAVERHNNSNTTEEKVEVVAGICGDEDLKQNANELKSVPIFSDYSQISKPYDVIIDFSTPLGASAAVSCAKDAGVSLVSCTTGLNAQLEEDIKKTGMNIPVLRARNTSIGVNALLGLVKAAAGVLDSKWEVEIVELHHRHKKDSPSGTAVALAESVCNARHLDFEQVVSSGRAGIVEESRNAQEVGVQAVRGGDVVGEHTVYFFSDGERIELTHRATNRRIFADGALQAALWLIKQRPGYYSMSDIVGIN